MSWERAKIPDIRARPFESVEKKLRQERKLCARRGSPRALRRGWRPRPRRRARAIALSVIRLICLLIARPSAAKKAHSRPMLLFAGALLSSYARGRTRAV